jgi:hypothetical protein
MIEIESQQRRTMKFKKNEKKKYCQLNRKTMHTHKTQHYYYIYINLYIHCEHQRELLFPEILFFDKNTTRMITTTNILTYFFLES